MHSLCRILVFIMSLLSWIVLVMLTRTDQTCKPLSCHNNDQFQRYDSHEWYQPIEPNAASNTKLVTKQQGEEGDGSMKAFQPCAQSIPVKSPDACWPTLLWPLTTVVASASRARTDSFGYRYRRELSAGLQ